MNIYDYIDKNEIKEYLKKNEYKFSTEEAIWLVSQNQAISFEDKKRAYESIIDTFPDYEYQISNTNIKASIHQLLIEYIALKEKLCYNYIKGKNEAIYKYSIHYINRSPDCNNREYNSYDEVIKVLSNEVKLVNQIVNISQEDYSIDKINITKIDSKSGKTIAIISLNKFLDIIDVSINDEHNHKSYELNNRAKHILYDFIDNMNFKFNYPFKQNVKPIEKY